MHAGQAPFAGRQDADCEAVMVMQLAIANLQRVAKICYAGLVSLGDCDTSAFKWLYDVLIDYICAIH